MEIKFWLDESEQKLIVVHNPSGECREIKKPEKIAQFLRVHGVTFEESKGVVEAMDQLHLFKKMRVNDKVVCNHVDDG